MYRTWTPKPAKYCQGSLKAILTNGEIQVEEFALCFNTYTIAMLNEGIDKSRHWNQ